jgi:hypothetical protein
MSSILRIACVIPFGLLAGCPNKPPEVLPPNCVDEGLCYQSVTSVPVGDDPLSTKVGDVDGDSDLDIVSVNVDTISVLKNVGGVLQAPQNLGVGVRLSSAALGDTDNDGDLDLVTAAVNGVNITQVLLFENDGTGTFSPAGGSATGDRAASFIALGDLNNDGFLDVVTPVFGRIVEVYLNNGQGQFGAATQIATNVGDVDILFVTATLADVDNDDNLDVVVSDFGGDQIHLIRNTGNAQFEAPLVLSVGDGPRTVVSADLNNDGFPELLTSNTAEQSIGILRNQSGTFAPAEQLALPEPVFSLEVADLDSDGLIDIATSNFAANSATLVRNIGQNQFGTPVAFEVPGNPFTVAVGDLNGDSLAEIIFGCFLDNTVTVLPASEEP